MQKTILITGATDGIGLETAKMLFAKGHHLLVHGRNSAKLNDVEKELNSLSGGGTVEKFTADSVTHAGCAGVGRRSAGKAR